jgi:hypothetical protein
MNSAALSLLAALHLSVIVPYVAVIVAAASAADAAFPQPRPGSHWLPVRKLVSLIALNLGNASNPAQPPFATWLVRVLAPLMAAQADARPRVVISASDIAAHIDRAPAAPSASPAPAAPAAQ